MTRNVDLSGRSHHTDKPSPTAFHAFPCTCTAHFSHTPIHTSYTNHRILRLTTCILSVLITSNTGDCAIAAACQATNAQIKPILDGLLYHIGQDHVNHQLVWGIAVSSLPQSPEQTMPHRIYVFITYRSHCLILSLDNDAAPTLRIPLLIHRNHASSTHEIPTQELLGLLRKWPIPPHVPPVSARVRPSLRSPLALPAKWPIQCQPLSVPMARPSRTGGTSINSFVQISLVTKALTWSR